MSPSPEKDPLTETLSHWRVRPARTSDFRAQVWTRIEAARHPSSWKLFIRAHPGVIGALMLAAIGVGAWSGRTEAHEQTEADRAQIAAAYVHTLDARWMRHP